MKRVNKSSVISLGIDQGIASCGYAVVEISECGSVNILKSGTLKTAAKLGMPTRIEKIYDCITSMVDDYDISIMGCERLFFNPIQKNASGGKGRNKSASIMYTNMITGVLYLLAQQKNLPIKDFTPGTVKKAVTGNGRATKEEVISRVNEISGNLKPIKTEHESDAIAIAITAIRHLNEENKRKE